jgi:hypothetical protein
MARAHARLAARGAWAFNLNPVVAYGANFDRTGMRLDIGQNAYFNSPTPS